MTSVFLTRTEIGMFIACLIIWTHNIVTDMHALSAILAS